MEKHIYTVEEIYKALNENLDVFFEKTGNHFNLPKREMTSIQQFNVNKAVRKIAEVMQCWIVQNMPRKQAIKLSREIVCEN